MSTKLSAPSARIISPATQISLALTSLSIILTLQPLKIHLSPLLALRPSHLGWTLFLLSSALLALSLLPALHTPLRFVYNCFLKPLGGHASAPQSERLDAFYRGQADVYDSTRTHLLKGREEMLQLLAAHLKAQPSSSGQAGRPGAAPPRIWVDIGGGTGWNIEKMDEYLPVTYFDKIYLVDLCQPLLEVARARFAAKGWKNVECLHQDASAFILPEWESGALDPRGSITAITLSYSLSMIPPFYQLLDRCDQVLDPQRGLMGVVDFYTSRDPGRKERAIGSARKRVSWFAKWFWECWFEFDNVHLHASRRDYLEYKMGTIKSFSARNNFLNSWFIQIPYYVFVGCSRGRDATTSAKAFEVDAGNKLGQGNGGLLTPSSPFMVASPPLESPNSFSWLDRRASIPELSIGQSVMQGKDGYAQTLFEAGAPLSPFHYQLRKSWRVPYLEEKIHEQFRTHIYGWTWEDPDVDVKKLRINSTDRVLAITSAGDNVLHYALAAKCEQIHAVDMNPCQGHILELKLAAAQALEYNDFWKIFGEGRHEHFERLLTSKMSPFLSSYVARQSPVDEKILQLTISHAFAYWMANAHQFKRNFYFRGYSGWALRLAQVAFFLAGVSKHVEALCRARTCEEQERIWRKHLRPILLNKIMLKGFLGNPAFNWHALGVPKNQMNCFLQDGSVEDFVKATLDPIPKLTTLRDDNYFFYLCLHGRYSRASCPAYLKPEGYQALRSTKINNAFKLHTDTILNVLRGLPDESLTKIIVMDSMDWFDPISPKTPLPDDRAQAQDELAATPEKALNDLRSELDYEILEMRRVLRVGGHAVWRSAAKRPWYRQRFELAGFKVEPIDIRENGLAIDRVNMYASFWRAEKMVHNGF